PTEAACPSAIGGSARSTARPLFSCRPSATANSQPIPGFAPWYRPSAPRVAQRQIIPLATGSREAERGRRRVAALQPHLMAPPRAEIDEEILVDLDAAAGLRVHLRHPPRHRLGLRVELLVPRGVERAREVDTAPVAAHLHHLRRARE